MTLKTETNTPDMEQQIREAFLVTDMGTELDDAEVQLDFEHGQWWVTAKPTGAQWSVHDADGPGTIDGFDFELVSRGEDE